MLHSLATRITFAGAIAAALPFAANAQTYNKIYDFANTASGGGAAVVSQPVGTPIITSSGVMYGVSYYGGSTTCVSANSACGTFFKVVPPATVGGAYTETTLYEFQGNLDGGAPNANPVYINGTFYGATYGGGASTPGTGNGTVYAMVPSKTGYTHDVIYSFLGGSDGSRPTFMTVLNNTLYGITNFGGTSNTGVVYQLTSPGSGQPFTESVIHTFNGTTEGGVPQYIVAYNGSLYVSLSNNGEYSGGTIVQLTPPTGGGTTWTTTVLFNFGGPNSPAYNPEGIAFGTDGSIYGAAEAGGGGTCRFVGNPGCGAIFQLKPPTTGTTWTYTQIYTFQGGNDSGAPYAPPAFNTSGSFYVQSTGTLVAPASSGAILRLTPATGGTFNATVLHTFSTADATDPAGLVMFGPTGTIYGFATYGGTGNNGAAYSVTNP